MQRSKIDVWVGLFVVSGLIALMFLVLQAANLLNTNFKPTYTITAQFSNIGGLKPRAAVTSAGVLVGRVDSVQFDDQSFSAHVKLNIDEEYLFPKDSSVQIFTRGVLGDQYIGIVPGFSDANWKEGDKIKNTQSAMVLEDLIGQFLTSQAESLGEIKEDSATK